MLLLCWPSGKQILHNMYAGEFHVNVFMSICYYYIHHVKETFRVIFLGKECGYLILIQMLERLTNYFRFAFEPIQNDTCHMRIHDTEKINKTLR